MRKRAHTFQLSPIERVQNEPRAYRRFAGFVISNNQNIERVIDRVKPDLIMMDFYVEVPAVINSGIPWVLIYSANPLRAYGNLPNAMAPGFGFSIHDPVEKFREVRELRKRAMEGARKEYCEWLQSQGVANPDPNHEMALFSPHLNVYSYPEELDYKELGPVPEKFFRLDHCVRPVPDDSAFEMDGKILDFINSKGKKIYFSLGSMASAQVELMKRLISMMAKCPHKFIISMGVFHDELQLPGNMVGAQFLNQLKILPHVDLVITHGGNNTFVESLYFGKRMIVLPVFGDQVKCDEIRNTRLQVVLFSRSDLQITARQWEAPRRSETWSHVSTLDCSRKRASVGHRRIARQ